MTVDTQQIQDELVQRHRTATMFVFGFLILDVLLLLIAYLFAGRGVRSGDESMVIALWIGILVCGLGAFVLRRTRFATLRLKDIAAVKGTSALLKTLQQTTIQVACLGGAVAVMGYAWSMLTHDWSNMLRAAGVSAIVLAYSYPFRSSWQRVVRTLSTE
jgi:hypothetical protein